MNLIRCDVLGCLAEFEVVSHEGPVPPGWRRESSLRVLLVPREALPPGVLSYPLPPRLKATVAVHAIICPAHPAGAARGELRESCFRSTPAPPSPYLFPAGCEPGDGPSPGPLMDSAAPT